MPETAPPWPRGPGRRGGRIRFGGVVLVLTEVAQQGLRGGGDRRQEPGGFRVDVGQRRGDGVDGVTRVLGGREVPRCGAGRVGARTGGFGGRLDEGLDTGRGPGRRRSGDVSGLIR
ncbi:hypothetical protein [Streptomyces sp. NPDC014995]|uniref:hypothetical protein n=1 Tax=Streptomyces sp. NPDC014995 TaxID=3364936 RepID=UPI0037012F27